MLRMCGPWSTLVEICRSVSASCAGSVGRSDRIVLESGLIHGDEAMSVFSVVRRVMTVMTTSNAGDTGDDGDLCSVHRDDR